MFGSLKSIKGKNDYFLPCLGNEKMLARGRRKIDYLYLITDADADSVADACAVAVAVSRKMGNRQLKIATSLLCCKGAILKGIFMAVCNSVAFWSNSPMS